VESALYVKKKWGTIILFEDLANDFLILDKRNYFH
jgi:hypothetical protein